MERFLRTLSIRRKKRPKTPESNGGSHPLTWQEDERKVREGICSFQVKYLGSVEVFESRGIQICEDAIKRLKSGKHKRLRAVLYVSGDALRVVDELSKGLLVDQTIEKVSFCAPDRYHTKGFAYICRDGTTRRWLCHGFLAVKESGERLSHAVGCAFAVCLEKKQKREREAVTVQYNEDRTSFTRYGSFRQASLAERLQDPQALIPAPTTSASATSQIEPEPLASGVAEPSVSSVVNQAVNGGDKDKQKALPKGAIERPHASSDLLERQASFRGFSKLQELVSPFKRGVSLRLGELPSNRERKALDLDELRGDSHSNSHSHSKQSTSTSESKRSSDTSAFGLSNSAFGALPLADSSNSSAAEVSAVSVAQQPTNGAGVGSNVKNSLWQTPTIVEEEEESTAVADDPFAAAPFKPTQRHVPQMHHSLTTGSIGNSASAMPTPTQSASPSVISGLSTPARPVGGFTLLASSSSMTPVAPSGVAPLSGTIMMTPVVMTPYGVMPVDPASLPAGSNIVMIPSSALVSPGNPLLATNNSVVPPAASTAAMSPFSSAQFAESSVPPSASRALFAASASAAPTSPTSGGPLDPFDVAWAEKQTTRARLTNPFANVSVNASASASVTATGSSNSQVSEAFKVSL